MDDKVIPVTIQTLFADKKRSNKYRELITPWNLLNLISLRTVNQVHVVENKRGSVSSFLRPLVILPKRVLRHAQRRPRCQTTNITRGTMMNSVTGRNHIPTTICEIPVIIIPPLGLQQARSCPVRWEMSTLLDAWIISIPWELFPQVIFILAKNVPELAEYWVDSLLRR